MNLITYTILNYPRPPKTILKRGFDFRNDTGSLEKEKNSKSIKKTRKT
jgi:hypothetical protein